MRRLFWAKYILTQILFSFFISCSNEINDPIAHFKGKTVKKIKCSNIIQLEDYDILKPMDAIRVEGNYFIFDNKTMNLFNLINPSSRAIIRGGEIGTGPQDVVMPSSFQYKDNKILFYDVSQKKINEIQFSLDSLSPLKLKEVKKIKFNKRLFVVNCIDTNYIATGIFNDYWLAVINKQGEVVSTIDFPPFEELKDTPKTQLSILYISSLMANSPNKKKMIAVTQKHGVISFFNYINGNELKEYKQLRYYAPLFDIQEKGNIAFSKDNKIGFCAVDCDDHYVYVLYSGKTFNKFGLLNHHCDNLLIYDWNGKPIKRYILEIPLFSMRYNKKNHSIYGIAYNPEGILIEYKLS